MEAIADLAWAASFFSLSARLRISLRPAASRGAWWRARAAELGAAAAVCGQALGPGGLTLGHVLAVLGAALVHGARLGVVGHPYPADLAEVVGVGLPGLRVQGAAGRGGAGRGRAVRRRIRGRCGRRKCKLTRYSAAHCGPTSVIVQRGRRRKRRREGAEAIAGDRGVAHSGASTSGWLLQRAE
jgi:hypothetical protein